MLLAGAGRLVWLAPNEPPNSDGGIGWCRGGAFDPSPSGSIPDASTRLRLYRNAARIYRTSHLYTSIRLSGSAASPLVAASCRRSKFALVIRGWWPRCSQVIGALSGIKTPLFMSGATRFKHQGFREEREVRIVAIPAKRRMLERELDKHPEYDAPDRWKHVHSRASKHIRYIKLFDTISAKLPIKRIIVGPSRNQDKNFARARAIVAEAVPVTRSATPFIG